MTLVKRRGRTCLGTNWESDTGSSRLGSDSEVSQAHEPEKRRGSHRGDFCTPDDALVVQNILSFYTNSFSVCETT
jgi:hypothetical protein